MTETKYQCTPMNGDEYEWIWTPMNGDIWLEEAPDVHMLMGGCRVVDPDRYMDEAREFAVRSGIYLKAVTPPRQGRWYRVLETADDSQLELSRGDVVVVDLSRRDHMLTMCGETRHIFKETTVVGKLVNLNDFELSPGQVLLKANPDKMREITSGKEGSIYLPQNTEERGIVTSELTGADKPGERKPEDAWKTEGVRVGLAEVADFAPDVRGLKKGDMVAYKSQVATTEFTILGKPFRVVARKHVLGGGRRKHVLGKVRASAVPG